MPIRPENRDRYPPEWRTVIRPAILARAAHRCEGSPAYPDCRAANGQPHPVTGSRVVLTIAHLNHTPEDNRPDNLRALCQRCHFTYDVAHHLETRRRRRAAQQWGGAAPQLSFLPTPQLGLFDDPGDRTRHSGFLKAE